MKVSVMYVTKDQKVITEKEIMKATREVAQGVVMIKYGGVIIPMIANSSSLPLTGIVAHAADVYQPNQITEAFDPLISALQDLAEPLAYGIGIKGFMQRMTCKESQGNNTLKNAAYGYLGIQFLPSLCDLIGKIKF